MTRSWVKFDVIQGVAVYWQKSDDSCPLKYWKAKIDVPCEKAQHLLDFILHKRRQWDIDLIDFKELASIDERTG